MTASLRRTGRFVFETPIFELQAAERPAMLVSDLHLGDAEDLAARRLFALLDSAGRSARRVFVLGDLFDSYVSPRQLRVGVWRETARRMQEARERGAEIVVLHGNRDFLLGRRFERAAGALVVPGGLLAQVAGQPTLLLHGDELCRNDLPYLRAKRWLRGRLVAAVSRALPLAAALAVAERARQKSRRVVSSGDQGRFLPTRAAVTQALAVGASRVVFGHIHRMAKGMAPGGESWTLPAFDEQGVFLSASPDRLFFAGPEESPWPVSPPALPCLDPVPDPAAGS